MYESFYGLHAKPFALIPDPRFIYWGGPHSIAFTMLEFGIINQAGFTVITGEIGAGKTTLLRHLLSRLPTDINVGLLPSAIGGQGDLLQWVLMAFNQDFEGKSPVALFRDLQNFLIQQHELGRRTILIIDEAQAVGASTLEELRLISNLNTYDRPLLQIVLSGQPELKQVLSQPSMVQFAQRVSSDFHLKLLTRDQVAAYIDHRLREAGAQYALFTPEACHLIHYVTRGTPRLINSLCDTALMYGFAMNEQEVTAEIVEKVLEDKRTYGVVPLSFNEPVQ